MIRLLALGLLFLLPLGGETPSFEQRVRTVIDFGARPKNLAAMTYIHVAAKLWMHQDATLASQRLEQLLAAGPSGDMFWMAQVTPIAYLDRGQLSEPSRKALRQAWKTYMPYRGDTENHWLVYYTCLYLAAQIWPGESGEEWFTGKSSEENLRESKEWIESWVRLTTTRGQGEYDSPQYLNMFLMPLSYLAAWAKDPAMKKRATMMLDYLVADYAAESLNGIYAGSHSRVSERPVLEKWLNLSVHMGWLLFGLGDRITPATDAQTACYALASAYQPPEIVQRIAADRSQPYTQYERKRTRHRWRFYDEQDGTVYKTTYVRREYAVGSDQGGILQPIQQHSWDVTWAVPNTRGVQNTLFTMHPYSSIRELQTFFAIAPDIAIEGVTSSKKAYDSPDKLVGGSPFEKVFQDQDSVIALYDIPAGTRFPHINGFFSKDLTAFSRDASGWIFVRGGDAWIACRPLQPYTLKPMEGGARRLLSPYLKNGMIVQVAAASEYPDMEAFRRAIVALPLGIRTDPVPEVRFRTLRGKLMEFTYGQTPRLDGQPLDYAHWPLFGGPFLDAAVDSEQLVLKYGKMRRTLDFKTLTVTDVGGAP